MHETRQGEAVTVADLQRVLRTWLDPHRRLLLSVVAPDHPRRALPGSAPVTVP